MSAPSTSSDSAFTLIELAMVVTLIALVALVAVSRVGGVADAARQKVAQHDLATLREAFLGGATSAGLVADMEGLPNCFKVNPVGADERLECFGFTVHNLFCPTNHWPEGSPVAVWRAAGLGFPPRERACYEVPSTFDGGAWRGPYLAPGQAARFPAAAEAARGFWSADGSSSPYGQAGDFALNDPWGNPYVLQIPSAAACNRSFPVAWRSASTGADFAFAERRWRWARLVSAGPNGALETPRDLCAGRTTDSVSARGDDLVLFLNRTDVYEDPRQGVTP